MAGHPGQSSARRPLGFGVTAGLGDELLVPLAREVERLGYGSFWANDLGRPEADGLADLAIVHGAAPSLKLGVGVLPLDRRSPREIVDHLSRLGLPIDRLLLGVGAGGATDSLRVVRGGLLELRRLLPTVRLYAAALGPRMCQLGGELADGVLLNWTVPERVRWAREQIATGAATAGRTPESIKVWAYVRAAVGRGARERLDAEARRYVETRAYRRAFRAMNVPFDQVGVAGADLPGQLEGYRAALDGVAVRALPSGRDLSEFMTIARAAAGVADEEKAGA
ncbi:MAG TPA: LLM class flavin-dependent oxidoreductase [Candidatus Saccharimonadales bacterium]|nr:LLM class flavin-dependent oxidoreductase [Candidatus Saccharimonadales bacterium]